VNGPFAKWLRRAVSEGDGAAFGVCGVEVAHGGGGGDAEDAHEVERVLGDGGLVQEAVGADVSGLEAKFVEGVGNRC
jgi:hypothetical protein